MELLFDQFRVMDDAQKEICLLLSLLPPPISLDLLCVISDRPPVKVLQFVEALVVEKYLLRYTQKGAGYYYLADLDAADAFLSRIPADQIHSAAEKAVSAVCGYYPDNVCLWLALANIYQVSGLPVSHFDALVKAGHYCLDLNLTGDAAVYYRMVAEGIHQNDPDRIGQQNFIDAVIGLCTCRDSSFSPDLQRKFLERALEQDSCHSDPVRRVKLRVLLARTFLKTARSHQADTHLDTAWQMLETYGLSNDIRLQVALTHSELFFWRGHIDKAIQRYESVISNHEDLPADVETLKSYIRLGWAYGVAAETARGVGLIRGVRRKARELGARDLERYATLILVIVLSDAGRIDEGEVFLAELFTTPKALLDHYTLWPGNGKKAFFAYCRGEYEKAFMYQKEAYNNSKALGTPHHRGADNLEIMLGLEARGMVHPEWNFESDIKRLLDWPDIYMQGVAYRFKALKAFNLKKTAATVEADLKKSLSLLTLAGARIELAHAQLLMARVRIAEKKIQEAERLLKSAWDIFSKVNPSLFPKDLKAYLDRTSKNALWVESLISVGDALGSIRTRNELLGQIIKQAMRIAGAERGAIFLRQDQRLEMVASRNIETPEISADTFADQMSLIEQVFTSGTETVRKATIRRRTNGGRLSTMGWTGCFPIRLKARVMGVIFMDCELARLQLPEDEICLLRIISNQAAVALENMEAYEEMVDLKVSLEAETRFYQKAFEAKLPETEMIGRTEPFKTMLKLISQVAMSDTTVMITGETGVGKDLVARTIHQHSSRSNGPFIAVNVVSFSPELIASELFGHEKGAFTGALQTHKGRFELAGNGTLFLDDIDAFSMDIQAKMLRVLESREFERVGGTRTLKTRFRLVAASNRNIEELVKLGLFRSDFYYRLNVFPIRIPSLRERVGDIPALARYFMYMFGKKFNKHFNTISKKDLQMLMDYHWPGNIRELRHVIERAVLLSRGDRLIIPPLNQCPIADDRDENRILPLKEMEARHIVNALSRCRGKVSGSKGAAALLEVKPTTLYSKMKRLGIEKRAYRISDPPAMATPKKKRSSDNHPTAPPGF